MQDQIPQKFYDIWWIPWGNYNFGAPNVVVSSSIILSWRSHVDQQIFINVHFLSRRVCASIHEMNDRTFVMNNQDDHTHEVKSHTHGGTTVHIDRVTTHRRWMNGRSTHMGVTGFVNVIMQNVRMLTLNDFSRYLDNDLSQEWEVRNEFSFRRLSLCKNW